MGINDRLHVYGFEPVKRFKTVKLTRIERLKRALVGKNLKTYFIKEIEVPIFITNMHS